MTHGKYERSYRKHDRKHLGYPGWIDLGPGTELIPAQIEDVSDGGAKMTVGNVEAIPDDFLLRLSLTAKTARRCAVVRRSLNGIGVQFIK